MVRDRLARMGRLGATPIFGGRGRSVPRDEALDALQRIHRRWGIVPVTELPADLYGAIRLHFGSIRVARLAIGIDQRTRVGLWTRERVLAELRRLDRRGVPISTSRLRAERGLLGAIRNHVGTLREARALAGIPDPGRPPRPTVPTQWDELEVVLTILQRVKTGQSLASSHVPSALYSAARKYWGSWRRALEATGLDLDAIRLVRSAWTKTEVIATLRKLRRQCPSWTRMELCRSECRHGAEKLFGSLDAALVAAGIRGWPRRERRSNRVAKAVLVRALRERVQRGASVRARDVSREDAWLYRTVLNVIPGTWREALITLGFRDPAPRWNRERVLVELRRIHARGESLGAHDHGAIACRARYYFGSLAAAAKLIGATVRPKRSRTRAEILRELRRHGRTGRVSIRRVGRALSNAAERAFGSWLRACRAAGVRPGASGRRR